MIKPKYIPSLSRAERRGTITLIKCLIVFEFAVFGKQIDKFSNNIIVALMYLCASEQDTGGGHVTSCLTCEYHRYRPGRRK